MTPNAILPKILARGERREINKSWQDSNVAVKQLLSDLTARFRCGNRLSGSDLRRTIDFFEKRLYEEGHGVYMSLKEARSTDKEPDEAYELLMVRPAPSHLDLASTNFAGLQLVLTRKRVFYRQHWVPITWRNHLVERAHERFVPDRRGSRPETVTLPLANRLFDAAGMIRLAGKVSRAFKTDRFPIPFERGLILGRFEEMEVNVNAFGSVADISRSTGGGMHAANTSDLPYDVLPSDRPDHVRVVRYFAKTYLSRHQMSVDQKLYADCVNMIEQEFKSDIAKANEHVFWRDTLFGEEEGFPEMPLLETALGLLYSDPAFKYILAYRDEPVRPELRAIAQPVELPEHSEPVFAGMRQ